MAGIFTAPRRRSIQRGCPTTNIFINFIAVCNLIGQGIVIIDKMKNIVICKGDQGAEGGGSCRWHITIPTPVMGRNPFSL